MTQVQNQLPKWILVVSAIIAFMELGVSGTLVFAPESVLETVDLHAKGVIYVVHMWAARQFALGFIFAFATIKRSDSMLTLAYIFFLVMFVGDLAIGIAQKENSLVISAIVMCIIASGMLFAIGRKR